MNRLQSENFGIENWAALSKRDRLEALQKLEDEAAQKQGRESNPIRFLPPAAYGHYPEDRDSLRLRGGFFEHEWQEPDGASHPKGLYLNDKLLENEQPPYLAVETVFHEGRHAYQHFISQNSQAAEDQDQAKDLAMEFNGGHLTGGGSYWQPSELDADHFAQKETQDFFETRLGDKSDAYYNYLQAKKEQVENEKIAGRVRYFNGFDATDKQLAMKAKKEMVSEYEKNHMMGHQQSIGTDADKLATEPQKSVTTNPQAEVVEDYEQLYGYGI